MNEAEKDSEQNHKVATAVVGTLSKEFHFLLSPLSTVPAQSLSKPFISLKT
jgi:hypothetical protein